MTHLDRIRQVGQQLNALQLPDGGPPARFNDVAAAVHGLCAAVTDANAADVPAEQIKDALASAWDIHAKSPFIRRLQTWPRGYAGDFETIEHLISGANHAPEATVEYWLEFIAVHSPIAQQHRNKVLWQAEQVKATLRAQANSRPSNVLVLAAGSSPDLAMVQDELACRPCQLVVNDGDADAIAFSKQRLAGVADKIKFIAGNVLSSAGKLAPFGPYDLVLAGGLFDYLPDRHAEFLLRTVTARLLAPGGRFAFTNVASDNPYRVWIEHLACWKLIERSETDIRRLVGDGCGTDVSCSVSKDNTGLTWLVAVESSAVQNAA